MKKNLLLALVAASLLSACNKESISEIRFEATLEPSAEKVIMNQDGALSWVDGDCVRLVGAGNGATGTHFEIASAAQGRAHLHQIDELDDDHKFYKYPRYHAMYPVVRDNREINIYNKYSDDNPCFRVDMSFAEQSVSDQQYHDPSALRCVGWANSSTTDGNVKVVNLQFRNCVSMLQVTIADGYNDIYQIKVTSDRDATNPTNHARLAGKALVYARDGGTNLATKFQDSDADYDTEAAHTVTLRKADANSALTPGTYRIIIWPDYYNPGNDANSQPGVYTNSTTKTNVTITPCDANGAAINGYGSYTVASYSFARNTIYPVGTFPKTNQTAQKASIFH